MDIDQIKALENADPKYPGLSGAEAQKLILEGKGNAVPKNEGGRSVLNILFHNLVNWFNILNLLLALALILVGSYRNLLFMGVVVFNTLIATVQEIKAKKTVDRLSLLAEAPLPVLRDGRYVDLTGNQMVLGDRVRFPLGSQICADALVLEGNGACDESLLSGESDPVLKERGSVLYSGSFVTEGTLEARLTCVGKDSYAGKLVSSVKKIKVSHSRLMDDLQKLIRIISFFLIPMGLLLFLKQSCILNEPLDKTIPSSVAAMIGMIPEGLMLLTSVALAAGVVKLGAKHILVNELYGIENLARVDIVCVDKTGTITEGKLNLNRLFPVQGLDVAELDLKLKRFTFSNPDRNLTTEALRYAYGVSDALLTPAPSHIPFSSARKWSAVGFEDESLVLGAPEFVFPGDVQTEFKERASSYALQGYRVLALAQSPEALVGRELPQALSPLGLILFNDKIREDFKDTALYLKNQGVKVKVISGDNPRTVAEVASRAGLPDAMDFVDATTLTSPEALKEAALKYTVFGRVMPEQKKQLILLMKEAGHSVAMMGDGVNDVPALKVADCAIAMAHGSDAAKKVAQITLMKNQFSALPSVILEGRRVINNITRSASLFLVKTCFSLLLSLLTLFSPFLYPFQAIQLTLVSSFSVGIPGFFLALEPNEERVRGNFLKTIFLNALPGALTNLFQVLLIFLVTKPLSLSAEQASTLAVYALLMTGMLVLYFTCRPLSARRLILLFAMALGMVLSCLFFPKLFLLVPLPQSAALLGLALVALDPLIYILIRALLKRLAGTGRVQG